jgi:hypothetical protein
MNRSIVAENDAIASHTNKATPGQTPADSDRGVTATPQG